MSELYELPEGWEYIKLKDIVGKEKTAIKRGPFGSALKKAFFVDNGYKIYEQKNAIRNDFFIGNYYINDEKFNELRGFEVKGGDIIISCSGTIGKIAVAPMNIQKGIINQALLKLTLNNDVIETSYFVNFWIDYVNKGMSEESTKGAAIKNLASVKILKELNIPLPPLQEQKRIVSKLDTLFKKIDKAIALHQKNMDEADVFMGSVLNELFGELEEKYESKSIKEISNIISGYAFKSTDFSNNNEIKSIKITNVGVQNFVENEDNKLSKSLLDKLSKYTVRENDIVIALTRPYISNGLKVTFVPRSYDGAFINQRVAAIQSIDKITNNGYIYYYLCTASVLSEVIELSKTLNQPNLSIKDLSNFKIPLPHLSIQQKTVKYLDQISEKTEKVKSVQKEKMERLKALKASILDRAFRGEL